MSGGDGAPERKVRQALQAAGITKYRITSTTRTATAQAAAMIRKVELYGYTVAEFHDLYKDDAQIDALWPYLQTRDAAGAAKVLQEFADKGRPLSAHMRAGAVDLVIEEATPAQLAAFLQAVEPGEVIHEEDHLHVQFGRSFA